ncbi:MAG: ABC transporter ATP-binding protein [Gammaproteobacteria bacterium]
MNGGIVVTRLGKRVRRYHHERPRSFKEAMIKGWRRLRAQDVGWALRDVTFEVGPGRMVGVIGRNGAGKSTLLRLIGGVGRPDEGAVTVKGRIGALLDLGAGFHQDLTGRENLFVNGIVGGLTRRELERRVDSIVAFAELEEFIDAPLRTYSSGMRMRLGFAIAAHCDPDVLLVDEALGVGDLAFQRKCEERITQFKEAGCTILLVSHDLHSVEQLCDEVVWLHEGRLVAHGAPDVVVKQYAEEMARRTRELTPAAAAADASGHLRMNENRFGSMEVEITGVCFWDGEGRAVSAIRQGRPLAVDLEYCGRGAAVAPIFCVTISKPDGTVCYDISTATRGVSVPVCKGTGRLRLLLDRVDLVAGEYWVDVGVYEPTWAYAYDYHWRAYSFSVRGAEEGKGAFYPPARWFFLQDQDLEHGCWEDGEAGHDFSGEKGVLG